MENKDCPYNNSNMDCKNCQYLIEHYGFCAKVNDWVEKPKGNLSFQ